MDEFFGYDILYPDLLLDILLYFDIDNKCLEYDKKNVLDFCITQGVDENRKMKVAPEIVARICEVLCKYAVLTEVKLNTNKSRYKNYIYVKKSNGEQDLSSYSKYVHYINSIVYGFSYIYRYYQDIVIPIIHRDKNDDISIGTGFKFYEGIVTAKHCLEGASGISIKGYPPNLLKKSRVLISSNAGLDIAYIETNTKGQKEVFYNEPKVLGEVLVMGYPKIPGFIDFLTGEKATVSSIVERRITPTAGSVVSIAENYFSKTKLMLITAKIRGGNSGGPVIDSTGSVVGIACQSPFFEGEYDDLGYGIATPISLINEIERDGNMLNTDDILFENAFE